MSDYQASRDFGYCLSFAARIAHSRGSSTLELRDLLAGLFIASLERLSKYWRDWEDFDELVATECGVREPRWFYWTQASGPQRQVGGAMRLLKELSAESAKAWAIAGELASARGAPGPTSRPLLTPEDFLLAIARQQQTPLGAKVASCLDLDRLELAVKTLRPRAG